MTTKIEDTNNGTTPRRRMGMGIIGVLGLALMAGASGCGQLSFMEVSVVVTGSAAVRSECLFAIDSCEITVSGTERDSFTLVNNVCVHPINFTIAKFQYGTDEDSGNIGFHVNIFDGNLKKLGEGDGAGAIKAGGRQPVTVNVTPDAAAFAPSCPN